MTRNFSPLCLVNATDILLFSSNMKSSSFLFQNSPPNAALVPNSNHSRVIPCFFFHSRRGLSQIKPLPITQNLKMGKSGRSNHRLRAVESGGTIDEDEDEDTELCPVDCVREFKTDEEFLRVLERAKETKSLVVVDFYRTSCGSCKYIEQGFGKLCRGAGDREDAVIFLKHNVIDEYDEQSEVAERLRIKAVPLFHFYKGGVLLESFPTRDKERVLTAIQKYTLPA